MADTQDIPALRYLLAKFIKDPRTIQAFENLGETAKEGLVTAESAYALATTAKELADMALALIELLSQATYVTMDANATLDNERVLTVGNLLKKTDGGAGGNVTIEVDRLTITGTDGVALTISGPTTLTLPDTGTLATLAGVETFSNKTLDQARVQSAMAAPAAAAINGTVPIVTGSGVKYVLLSNAP